MDRPPIRKPGLRAKLVMLGSSLLFVLLLLLVAEGLVRLSTDIPFGGNSRNLFVAEAWGASAGNAPGVEAVSFGATIHTDADGFRVPRDHVEQASGPAILILGDSVGFGPGVEESRTVAGRLRASLPATRVLNSSVIGYAAGDYRNFVEAFLPRAPELRAAYLIFCLNDVSRESAAEIDAELERREREEDAHGLVGTVKRLPIIGGLHGFLRSRSKLYLLARNTLADPRERYWKSDSLQYAVDDAELARRLAPVVEVARRLEARGIPFTVVLSPYEYQLRADTPEIWEPQRRLTRLLEAEGVRVLDAADSLRAGPSPSELFLPGDPMHLSAEGHALVHSLLLEDLRARSASGG